MLYRGTKNLAKFDRQVFFLGLYPNRHTSGKRTKEVNCATDQQDCFVIENLLSANLILEDTFSLSK